jgi:hypothetical protein
MRFRPRGDEVRQRARLWPASMLTLSFGAAGVTAVSILSPIRAAVILPFLLICPGLVLVRRLHFAEWWIELLLGIGASIALDVLLSTAMLYAGLWSPKLLLTVLIGLTLLASVYDLVVASLQSS